MQLKRAFRPLTAFLMFLLFCSFAVFAFKANTPPNSSFDTISIEWSWKKNDGQTLYINTELNSDELAKDKEYFFKLSYSLSYPKEAIRAYITPRLSYAMELINRYTPESEVKLSSLEQALNLNDNSLSSQLFWQAYRQYQSDAFNHFQISPCMHPTDTRKPCVRPNYSNLFYHYKGLTKNLAVQLKSNGEEEIKDVIQKAQNWLASISDVQERTYSFSSPLNVLSLNQADSDEKALLLATIVSELAPAYELFIVYPENSVGSVSPAWLVIDAKSGAKGDSIYIENKEHILISGSNTIMDEILNSHIALVSERLY